MRKQLLLSLSVSFFLLFASTLQAAPEDFGGEWFLSTPKQKTRFRVHDCSPEAKTCKISALSLESTNVSCSFNGKLTIDSATHAIYKSDYCTFDVTLTPGATPRLGVKATGSNCGAHCTGEIGWPTEGVPLFQKENFQDHSIECFETKSPSKKAFCTSKEVVQAIEAFDEAIERARRSSASALGGTAKLYALGREKRAAITQACDTSSAPAACLIEAFKKESADLEAKANDFDKTINAPGSKEEARNLISNIEGVYKSKVKSGFIDGSKYDAEDVLELVRVSDSEIYFKVRLQFFNGHACNLHGVAEHRKAGFLFEEGAKDGCRLLIEPKKDRVALNDLANCQQYCGARGSWNGAEFATSRKRKIKYLPVILASDDYKSALSSYERRKATKPSESK